MRRDSLAVLVRRLSWSIYIHFVAIHSWNLRRSHKLQKKLGVGGLRSFKVIDVDKSEKPVTSVRYDMQQVCTCLQPFSHYESQ